MHVTVLSLYKFVTLDNSDELRDSLLRIMQECELRGTLILAHEGINGTVAGSPDSIDELLAWFARDGRFANVRLSRWQTDEVPFQRAKVKVKKEIVTMRVAGIDPIQQAGTYVKPTEWNALIADPDTVVIDTRNDFEVEMGTFRNAINPHTGAFGEFPEYVDRNLAQHKDRTIAMFCTGGIRCEKATSYLRSRGFGKVFHLEGGILSYLQQIEEADSRWQGKCFVFDERIVASGDDDGE